MAGAFLLSCIQKQEAREKITSLLLCCLRPAKGLADLSSAENMVSAQEANACKQDQKGRLLEKQADYHAKSQAKKHKTK
jgi:hypothetical protein